MLTPQQQKVLTFIKTYRAEWQSPPTQAEIGRHFGWASPNAVVCHLRALERKGAIRRISGKARGIMVLA